MKRFLLNACCFLLPFFALGLFNAWVDDANVLRDRKAARAARMVAGGSNVTGLVNFNERSFRRVLVQNVRDTPDVVVLGSSRAMQIGGEAFPQKRLLNLGLSGAVLQDLLGSYELLLANDHVPDLLVICLDPWLVNSNHGDIRYIGFGPELAALAARFEWATAYASFSRQASATRLNAIAAELFNPAYVVENVRRLLHGHDVRAVANPMQDTSVVCADGSYVYGRDYREPDANERSNRVRRYLTGGLYHLSGFDRPDPDLLRALKEFLASAMATSRVVLLLPPYHPDVFRAIAEATRYQAVLQAEGEFRRIAEDLSLSILGSFDPAVVGAAEEDFYDGMHPTRAFMTGLLLPIAERGGVAKEMSEPRGM